MKDLKHVDHDPNLMYLHQKSQQAPKNHTVTYRKLDSRAHGFSADKLSGTLVLIRYTCETKAEGLKTNLPFCKVRHSKLLAKALINGERADARSKSAGIDLHTTMLTIRSSRLE
jgi:hypothetical protein